MAHLGAISLATCTCRYCGAWHIAAGMSPAIGISFRGQTGKHLVMDKEMDGVELGGSGTDRPGELLSLTELVLEMVAKLA